jgi:hypothetical protein
LKLGVESQQNMLFFKVYQSDVYYDEQMCTNHGLHICIQIH